MKTTKANFEKGKDATKVELKAYQKEECVGSCGLLEGAKVSYPGKRMKERERKRKRRAVENWVVRKESKMGCNAESRAEEREEWLTK